MYLRYTRSIISRLEYLSIPEPNSGCWIWLGAVNSGGYGTIRIGPKTRLAHRVMVEQVRGQIPDGMLVCHSCDVPPCINPDHLWLGSSQDNSDDCVKKNRFPNRKGDAHPRAGLTDQMVEEIIGFLELGVRIRELGGHYGVSKDVIRNIKHKKSWSHLVGRHSYI